jgi:hypothetical protein
VQVARGREALDGALSALVLLAPMATRGHELADPVESPPADQLVASPESSGAQCWGIRRSGSAQSSDQTPLPGKPIRPVSVQENQAVPGENRR